MDLSHTKADWLTGLWKSAQIKGFWTVRQKGRYTHGTSSKNGETIENDGNGTGLVIFMYFLNRLLFFVN